MFGHRPTLPAAQPALKEMIAAACRNENTVRRTERKRLSTRPSVLQPVDGEGR
jgi:hypothetical protein